MDCSIIQDGVATYSRETGGAIEGLAVSLIGPFRGV